MPKIKRYANDNKKQKIKNLDDCCCCYYCCRVFFCKKLDLYALTQKKLELSQSTQKVDNQFYATFIFLYDLKLKKNEI